MCPIPTLDHWLWFLANPSGPQIPAQLPSWAPFTKTTVRKRKLDLNFGLTGFVWALKRPGNTTEKGKGWTWINTKHDVREKPAQRASSPSSSPTASADTQEVYTTFPRMFCKMSNSVYTAKLWPAWILHSRFLGAASPTDHFALGFVFWGTHVKTERVIIIIPVPQNGL